MTVLRLEAVDLNDADVHVGLLNGVTLARSDDGVSLECAGDDGWAVSVLARAGLTTTIIAAMPEPAAGCIPARATDLMPVIGRGVVDVVRLRQLDPGEATARLRSTGGRWPFRRPDRDAIRAVLRDEDRVIAWRRVVWAKPSVMRSRALRGVRPLVFDRSGVDDGRESAQLATRGEITRWLRG